MLDKLPEEEKEQTDNIQDILYEREDFWEPPHNMSKAEWDEACEIYRVYEAKEKRKNRMITAVAVTAFALVVSSFISSIPDQADLPEEPPITKSTSAQKLTPP